MLEEHGDYHHERDTTHNGLSALTSLQLSSMEVYHYIIRIQGLPNRVSYTDCYLYSNAFVTT